MKKISLILLATVAVFASCSKHNDALPVVNPEEAWKYDINLPVPIQFNTSSIATRAYADLLDGTQMPDDGTIGIIGLQPKCWKNGEEGALVLHTEGWSIDKPETILLNNDPIVTQSDGSIKTGKYYPAVSDNYYSFYAYYPYREGKLDANGYSVTYDIGYEDIVWAKTDARLWHYHYMGFNARYLRTANERYGENGTVSPGTLSNYMPELKFNHLLTALNFYAVSAETTTVQEEDGSETVKGKDVENVFVSKVTVVDAVTKATLVVVDEKVGLYPSWNSPTESKTGHLIPSDNPADVKSLDLIPDVKVQPTSGGNHIGSLLLCPSTTSTTLEINVTLQTTDGTETLIEGIKLTKSDGFKAGNRYNFSINVWDTMEVEVKSTLVKWNDVPSTEQEPTDIIISQ